MDNIEQTTSLPALPNDDLTPLEQDVLEEYERLAENMKKVNHPTLVLCNVIWD